MFFQVFCGHWRLWPRSPSPPPPPPPPYQFIHSWRVRTLFWPIFLLCKRPFSQLPRSYSTTLCLINYLVLIVRRKSRLRDSTCWCHWKTVVVPNLDCFQLYPRAAFSSRNANQLHRPSFLVTFFYIVPRSHVRAQWKLKRKLQKKKEKNNITVRSTACFEPNRGWGKAKNSVCFWILFVYIVQHRRRCFVFKIFSNLFIIEIVLLSSGRVAANYNFKIKRNSVSGWFERMENNKCTAKTNNCV